MACSAMRRNRSSPGSTPAPTKSGVLAKSTVLEIVHDEGQHLQAAAHARAEAVYARDPEALRLFVPAPSPDEPDAEPGGPDDGDRPGGGGSDPGADRVPRRPHGSPRGQAGPPPAVDPDVVLVELDEVKVHAQAHTGRKEVLVFTALVMIADAAGTWPPRRRGS